MRTYRARSSVFSADNLTNRRSCADPPAARHVETPRAMCRGARTAWNRNWCATCARRLSCRPIEGTPVTRLRCGTLNKPLATYYRLRRDAGRAAESEESRPIPRLRAQPVGRLRENNEDRVACGRGTASCWPWSRTAGRRGRGEEASRLRSKPSGGFLKRAAASLDQLSESEITDSYARCAAGELASSTGPTITPSCTAPP